jgi:MraZ protein
MTTLFHGSELCSVDPAGNVPIPGFVGQGDGELLVSRHESDACLIGYGREHLDRLIARTERRRLAGEAQGEDARSHYRRMRRTFGMIDRLARAGDRLRIPPAMRHLGRIERLALFVGAGDSFEIWNPELAMQSGDEQFRDLAAFRMEAIGAEGSAF